MPGICAETTEEKQVSVYRRVPYLGTETTEEKQASDLEISAT